MSEACAASGPEPLRLEIPRRENLSRDEFVGEYLLAGRPVIVTDAIRDWTALSRWSPEFFRAGFGPLAVRVLGERTTVGDVVDGILHPVPGRPAPYLHTTSPGGKMEHVFPELMGDIRPLPGYLAPNWLEDRCFPRSLERRLRRGPQAELFLGGAGGRFSLHWDSLYFHVFAFQIWGEKAWTLYAPDQTPRLYPREEVHTISQIEDAEHPDLARFPLFAGAVAHRCTLRRGEMLFFPGGWWHTTRMHQPSISVSINTANASNWSQMAAEIARKTGPLAPAVRAYFAGLKALKSRRAPAPA
jgi:hypothetical protein